MKYVSNRGNGGTVDFETAILDGFASDGGLYVPERLPHVTMEQLKEWKSLSYKKLAFEIISLFVDRAIIPEEDLKELLDKAYDTFEKEETIPIYQLKSRKDTHIMELFYGPTLSFKDVGLAFLVNLFDYFLQRKKKKLSVIVATTGDTGPAAAHFIAGKSTLDAWVLYPKGMITEEQERQMTTLHYSNVHPFGVFDCPDGGDDLDIVIARLYANKEFKEKVNLSSVNSINWGRIMIQTVHYFYGYLKLVDQVGEKINISVPSGAFGNLCAGSIARMMGLPIQDYIVANNENACLHRIFSQGYISKEPIHETVSSAIDILIPYNFWRYLYFALDQDAEKTDSYISSFQESGKVVFDKVDYDKLRKGYLSTSITDEKTLATIREVYNTENYLLDPHGAVAVSALSSLKNKLDQFKNLCLATAHPCKFSDAIRQALKVNDLPVVATHESVERAKSLSQKGITAYHSHLEHALIHAMESHWDQSSNS